MPTGQEGGGHPLPPTSDHWFSLPHTPIPPRFRPPNPPRLQNSSPFFLFRIFVPLFASLLFFFLFGTKSSGSNSPPTTISAIWLAAGLSRFHFGYFSLPPRLCRCWLVRSCCSNAIGPFVLIFIEIHSIVDTNETFKNPTPFHALKI